MSTSITKKGRPRWHRNIGTPYYLCNSCYKWIMRGAPKRRLPMENRKCSACGSEKTSIDKEGCARWFFIDNLIFCSSCYYEMKYPRKFQSRQDWLRFNKQRARTLVLERWRNYEPPSRECYACGATESTLNKYGGERWFPNTTQNYIYYLCFKCAQKYLYNPKRPRKYLTKEDVRKALSERRLLQVFPKQDTQIEVKLQNALLRAGITFSKHEPIYGQPDIFIEPNICIFADGDYWHANPKFYKADTIIIRKGGVTAREIWQRDALTTVTLELMGYKVLRFWEDDIDHNVDDCISRIIPLAISK